MGKIVKKNVSLLAFLILPWCAQAAQQKVTEDVAQKVAVNFIKARTDSSVQVASVVEEKKNDAVAMYVCNLQGGGWVMVSANYSVSPVLAYSYEGAYNDDPENLATSGLIEMYKDGICALDSIAEGTVSEKWAGLIGEGTTLRSLSNPEGKDMLLDETLGGKVKWSQDMNLFCPKSETEGGPCEHSLAGSVPVAVSQLMWKWKWPIYSSVIDNLGNSYEDYYDWSLMKSVASTDEEKNEISRIINRTGLALGCSYGCDKTTWKLKDNSMYSALKDFGYNSYEAQNEALWRSVETKQYWNNLLVSEIRAGRPVLCVLDNAQASVEQMVVLSGFQYLESDGQYYYFVNAGEASGFANGYYNLDFSRELLVCGKTANNADVIGQYKQQRVYVGISPYSENTCENNPLLNEDENMDKMSMSTIVIPCDDSFTAKANSTLSLSSVEEIVFKSGFTAENGSVVTATIMDEAELVESEEVDIYARLLNVKTGANPSFTIDVKNANSWILKLGANNSAASFCNAGNIENDGNVVIESGWKETWSGEQDFEIILLNNHGIIKKISGNFESTTYSVSNYQSAVGQYANIETEIEGELNQVAEAEIHFLPFIYPNPATDEFTVSLNNTLSTVTVFDMHGKEILTMTGSKDMRINMSAYGKGMYIVKVVSNAETKFDKLLLK